MCNLVKIDHAVSEKKFKDFTILYMYIASSKGNNPGEQNFNRNHHENIPI